MTNEFDDSICCLEDGLSISGTRITTSLGGDQIDFALLSFLMSILFISYTLLIFFNVFVFFIHYIAMGWDLFHLI